MIANGRIIVANYYPGAGGNFVQNCLGLSKHCVLRDENYARWQITTTVNSSFYQQKLKWVLDTLPPVIDHTWTDYELGSHRLIGFRIDDQHDYQSIPKIIHQVAEKKLWMTIGTHSHMNTKHLTRIWPEIKYINILAPDWAHKWKKIKKNKSIFGVNETHQIPNTYLEWEYSPGAYNFDLDKIIKSESTFLETIHELYELMGWDDFIQTPIAEYYRAYISTHN